MENVVNSRGKERMKNNLLLVISGDDYSFFDCQNIFGYFASEECMSEL